MSLPPHWLLAVFLLFSSGLADAQEGEQTAPLLFRVLPDERIFPRLHASGQAHQLGIAKDLRTRLWLGDIGGDRPLLELTGGPVDVQAGIAATVHAGIIRKPPLLQVVTVDFVVDFPIDIRITPEIALRTGYGHFSAHMADDGIEVLGLHPINYAKDYLTFLGSYRWTERHAMVYGGFRYDFHTLPEETKHLVIQLGGEARPVRLFTDCWLYAAFDIRFKEETAWRVIQSLQVGCDLTGHASTGIRVAATFRTGSDDRGQLYNRTLVTSLFGVYIDL